MKRLHSIVTFAVLAGLMMVWPGVWPGAGTAMAGGVPVFFWTGGADGTFSDPGEWDQGVPGPANFAVFTQAFAGAPVVTVTFTEDASTLGLDVGDIDVTFNLGGNTYAVMTVLNVEADGLLTINNGTLSALTANINSGGVVTVGMDAIFETGTATLGSGAGSTGQVDVAGAWTSSTSILVGNAGTGVLNVGHDGVASTGTGGSVSTSTLIVGGANGGEGTINLGENAMLESDIANIASANGSTGTVNIGADASWTNSFLITVGAASGTGGTGLLNVEAGGLLHTQHLTVGDGGTVTQTGTGAIVIADTSIDLSTLDQDIQDLIDAGGLFVASNSLTITNGGLLEAVTAFIDSFAPQVTAAALVTGEDSLLDLAGGELTVGGTGNGMLVIADGGRVESGDVVVGEGEGSNGAVSVSGQDASANASQLNIAGTLAVGGEGAGELHVAGGGLVTTTGDGAIGAVEGGSGTVTVSGLADPEDELSDPSTLDIGGNLTVGHAGAPAGAAVAEEDVNASLMVSSGGLVIVNGGAGLLTITESGLLGGDGMIDGSVELFGRIFPGSSPGTLTITGDFETHEGSILHIEYNDEPLDLAEVFPNLDPGLVEDLLSSGVIAVQGTATLADGTVVEIVKLSGGAAPGDSFIILHTETGGLDPMNVPELAFEGTFLLDWIVEVIEDGGEQYLLLTAELDEPGLEEFLGGLTGNLANVADAIVEGELFDLLTTLNEDDPEGDLMTLLPLQHGATASQAFRTSQMFNSAFLQEMSGRRIGLSGGAFSASSGGSQGMIASAGHDRAAIAQAIKHLDGEYDLSLSAMQDERSQWGSFISGMGIWERVDTGDDRVGHDANVAGVYGGIHNYVSPEFLLGLSLGYLRTSIDFRNGFGEGEIDTVRIGPYLSWTPGGGDLFIDASATFGYHRNDVERETTLGTASGEYDAYDIAAIGQAGYDFRIFERTVLTPLIGVEYAHLRSESFDESGAGAANLSVSSHSTDSLRLRAGARIALAMDFGNTTVVPELYGGIAHELMDEDVDLQSQFLAGGPSFTTRAAGAGRDALQVSAGFTAMSGTYITLFVRYEGEFQSDRTSHGIVGGLNIDF